MSDSECSTAVDELIAEIVLQQLQISVLSKQLEVTRSELTIIKETVGRDFMSEVVRTRNTGADARRRMAFYHAKKSEVLRQICEETGRAPMDIPWNRVKDRTDRMFNQM